MNRLHRIVVGRSLGSNLLRLPALLCAALSISPGNVAADRDAHAIKCKKLHAQILAVATTEGCTSVVGLCTAGTIEGNRGVNGTTYFTADSIERGPATALDAASTVSYSGLLVITTQHGTLTSRDTGVFNTVPAGTTTTAGFFSSYDHVESGTGRFENATGTFVTGGHTVDGQLESEVQGEICMPR